MGWAGCGVVIGVVTGTVVVTTADVERGTLSCCLEGPCSSAPSPTGLTTGSEVLVGPV